MPAPQAPSEPVPPEAISVIIQGPAFRPAQNLDARTAIASVRAHLPGAEIILSTWPDIPFHPGPGVRLITGPPPPPLHDANGLANNLNRQIASTRAGLHAATRPFALKLRSDMALTGPALARRAPPPPHLASHPLRVATGRIVITDIYTRDPLRLPMLFHPSDTVQFGTHADLLAYWNQPDLPPSALLRPQGPIRNPFATEAGYTAMRLVPEQALCLSWLRRHGIAADLAHICDGDPARMLLWETVLAANFLVLPHTAAQIAMPPRFTRLPYTARTLYRPETIAWLDTHAGSPAHAARAARWPRARALGRFLRPSWWVSTAAVILFASSPPLARAARRLWRLRTGWPSPSPDQRSPPR